MELSFVGEKVTSRVQVYQQLAGRRDGPAARAAQSSPLPDPTGHRARGPFSSRIESRSRHTPTRDDPPAHGRIIPCRSPGRQNLRPARPARAGGVGPPFRRNADRPKPHPHDATLDLLVPPPPAARSARLRSGWPLAWRQRTSNLKALGAGGDPRSSGGKSSALQFELLRGMTSGRDGS